MEESRNINYMYSVKDNSLNHYGYPYAFIGSTTYFHMGIRIEIDEDYYNHEYFKSLSGSFYLLTTFNSDVFFNYYKDFTTTIKYYDAFHSLSVCSRKNTDRNVMFYDNHNLYTNCSCWSKRNDTEMNEETLFNYPDCNYNSSMFDLILPTFVSTTFTLSDELLEWYSIIFTSSKQAIQINNGSTLIIDELNINKNDISFNENVYVKNLTISTIGSSFNTLNFDTIDTSLIIVDVMLFTIQSTSTNLYLFGLEQIGNGVYYQLSCIYIGSCYVDKFNSTENNCSLSKINYGNIYNLTINTFEYDVNEKEHWNGLKIKENELTIDGTSTLTSNICEFENKTITINCNLYCVTMNINSNTKLIVNGELIIGELVINDGFIKNLNENGVIESYGSIEIISIEIKGIQLNCFELISSNESLSQISIYSDYSTLLLSQNHLLRICPSSNKNYEVQCTTIENTFEQQSFDILHCPCNDDSCIINVKIPQLDSRNIEFDGLFNILSDSTIAVSYQTSSFSIISNNKQILLIGNGAIGFGTSLNTISLESEPITISISSSNQIPCKALLIKNNNQQCIAEDYAKYPRVGDIDNCQLQNGYGCEICYEGYESNITYCNKCPYDCLRCHNGSCINCKMDHYINTNGKCSQISDPIEIFDNSKTIKCNDGYYSNGGECIKCSINCLKCNSSQCLTCNDKYKIISNGTCQEIQVGEKIISNYGVIDCNDGYYSNNSQCIDCSLTFDNCGLCNINGCLSCLNGVIINNGSCSLNTNCLNVDNSKCLSCNDKGSWFNGNECLECGNNCKNCINYECIECDDNYILQSKNNCVDTNKYPDNCITLSYYGTCQRCSDGYYLNNNLCYECSNECSSCHNLTYCFECNDGYMLNSNNECVDMSEIYANCKTEIPGSTRGCAICNNGYYINQTSCLSCIDDCSKCNNGESCLICESDYFLLNDASECISYDDLTNCETPTQSGCTKCINSSYYLNNQYCISCSDTTENCNTCTNNGECLTCQNDYILINYDCIHYQLIDNCKESKDSKCTSCSFWNTLNSDQTGCDTQVVWWVVVLIILVILIILIGICVLISYVTKSILDWRKQQKLKETIKFLMKKSKIVFKSTNTPAVVINKDEILFNDECEEIGVNEETRDLICVGNTSKHTIKVQFSVKDGCDKYEIRTNPQLITLKKGEACEFEIFIKPLCTCNIDDQIMLISVDLTEGKTITTPIIINTQTIMTTRLDYYELIEDKKLGEGSFGIVYKGTFRGNKVAIKKLKEFNDGDAKAMKEFDKEVSMLDKFRNDYIVHFYGAVFIPTKICMVTEFAQYGSLQDLMNKTKDNPIHDIMKITILLDCSKGIEYLHSNGILHRDIKPDNFLILSLDTNVQVNAKLTDFGSSRNVNMLMTNMTFTSGVGTPKYMAPEILKHGRYLKSADIYSFAITMFETMTWDEAYPKEQFIYQWEIADFVSNGGRLPKPDTMNESIYSLITNCWRQEPKRDIQSEK